ncbi:MAG: DUF4304 domain-containing protein [Bacillus sp. (in: firmicutes)]
MNEAIRRILVPTLKENGFSETKIKHNWAWHDDSIWVLDLYTVDGRYENQTGWPYPSIFVNMGFFDKGLPLRTDLIKVDRKGELLPTSYQCHEQRELYCTYDQTGYTNGLKPKERVRKDIWWVEKDGSNIEEVVIDIEQSFQSYGMEWLIAHVNPQTNGVTEGRN